MHYTVGIFIWVITFVLIPDPVYAWWPGTHYALARQLLESSVLSGMAALIYSNPRSFIYGNVMGDYVIGKSKVSDQNHPHRWHIVDHIQNKAQKESEIAFALGYRTHVAADTVAHNEFLDDYFRFNLGYMEHIYWEIQIEKSIVPDYRDGMRQFVKAIPRRNEQFLQAALPEIWLPENLNSNLIHGLLHVTANGSLDWVDYFTTHYISNPDYYTDKSLKRMRKVLTNDNGRIGIDDHGVGDCEY